MSQISPVYIIVTDWIKRPFYIRSRRCIEEGNDVYRRSNEFTWIDIRPYEIQLKPEKIESTVCDTFEMQMLFRVQVLTISFVRGSTSCRRPDLIGIADRRRKFEFQMRSRRNKAVNEDSSTRYR